MNQNIASKQQLEDLLEKARASISDFCLDDCHESCCNNHYIKTKDPNEVRAIYGLKSDQDLSDIIDPLSRLSIKEYSLRDDEYIVNLTPCPQLKGNACQIHENPSRPKICKDYPIEVVGKKVSFNNNCTAVKEGLLDSYHQDISDLGYQPRITFK